MRFIWLVLFLFILNGCGYKPSSNYAKSYIGDKIYANVEIFLNDPENAVVLKDALYKAIKTRFHINVAETRGDYAQVDISLSSLSFIPIQYDTNGYVIFYQTKVVLNTKLKVKDKTKFIQVYGLYNFPIEPNSILNDQLRYTAIYNSAQKALDSLLAKISIDGLIESQSRFSNDN